ncbi:response regulator [Rhizorhabdus dicambivorans]|nr:response regulator [Rhizorhabdus dicambivorans]
MEQFRILIIDDSLVIRGMMTNILSADREILVIGAASSAEQALLMLKDNPADAVTLDMEMPGVTGLQLLPILHRLDIPAVLISGHASEGSDLCGSALVMGAYGCFNKADAVREPATLIALVKAAARHKATIGKANAAAMHRVQDNADRAADRMGLRREWHAAHNEPPHGAR